MDQRDLILACLTASEGRAYRPVQIQKLVFLFQEKAPQAFPEGNLFNFEPSDYGPFDPTVYRVLEELADEDKAEIIGSPLDRNRLYRLSEGGVDAGREALNSLEGSYRDYLKTLSEWVLGQSFAGLVGAIYQEFPAMKVNSVFQE